MKHRNHRVVAVIQARMGASRLPGKVMMALAGEPMLVRVVDRIQRARSLDEIVVATTTSSHDEPIVALCQERGWSVFRGSEEDVLDRYYRAAVAHRADAVVRITSDCPLVDPGVIDKLVQKFLSAYPDIDYVSNTMQRTFPRGLDTEVISFKALDRAWREDSDPSHREHVTQYIVHNPGLFRIRTVENEVDYSSMRWTVDTPEDLAFVRKVYNHFQNDDFNWTEVLPLLASHPDWLAINRNVQQKVIS